MVWSWLRCEAIMATVLGFVSRAVASAAACIGCFRSEDSSYRLLPAPDGEFIENQNVASDLSVSDGELQRDDEERWNLLFDGFDVGELKDEAEYLKTRGTIPETPIEIRKALSAGNVEAAKSSGFKPWLLPKTSMEKLNLETEADERSRGADSPMKTPSPNSCTIEGHNSRRDSQSPQNSMTPTDTNGSRTLSSVSSVSPGALHTSLQCREKTVRFDFEPNDPRVSSEKNVYPTPLKLSDEMQTPGTAFTGNLNETAADGKAARIRSQYVYSLPNPAEYTHHLKELNREISDFASLQELEVNGNETFVSTPGTEKAGKDSTRMKNIKNEPTLADPQDSSFVSDSKENEYIRKTPRDRPIMGFAPPAKEVRWGENGIPNSTTKYKEDQKVHWHETPFEKRLEKALSSRTFNLQERRESV